MDQLLFALVCILAYFGGRIAADLFFDFVEKR